MSKVTWESSGRIHRTRDGLRTVCGHDLRKYACYKTTKKRKCKTCFTGKADHKEPWLLKEVENNRQTTGSNN